MREVRSGRDLVAALAVLAVVAQIGYPLLSGAALRALIVTCVVIFCAASVGHAALTLGRPVAARLLVGAGGLGLVAEAVGVRTGFPFGSYDYTAALGPRLLDVPVVVPLAWTMMAYPCLVLARRLVPTAPGPDGAPSGRVRHRPVSVAVTGGVALAAWDLFLDPQMVGAGCWRFAHPEPGLPGVPGIPLTNYAGWLLVATAVIAILDRVLPDGSPGGGPLPWVPPLLLGWTWLGSVVANLAFFDRPAVAAWGGVGMGITVGPYLWRVVRGHAPRGAAEAAENEVRQR